jgi:hypothetical protein
VYNVLLTCCSEAGEPIKCGTTIRLEHLQTQTNVHTHLFASPISRQQEVRLHCVLLYTCNHTNLHLLEFARAHEPWYSCMLASISQVKHKSCFACGMHSILCCTASACISACQLTAGAVSYITRMNCVPLVCLFR